jgi:hypothetical protein
MARQAMTAFAALAAADALLAATGRDQPRWLTKPLLMPVLMVGRDRPTQRALEKFGGLKLPAHEAVVMATYTTAQALLASTAGDWALPA